MDPLIGHCEWYGIKCNDANNTVKLEVQSNGLSGTLIPNIASLSFLKVLDLNNNNIKVRDDQARLKLTLKLLSLLSWT